MGGEVHGKASAALGALLAGGGRLLVEGLSPEIEALRAAHGEAVVLVPVGDRANAAVALGLALSGRVAVLALSSARRVPAIVEVLTDAAAVAGRVPLLVEVPVGEGGELDAPCLDALAAIDGLQVAWPRDGAAYGAALTALAAAGRPAVLLRTRGLGAGGEGGGVGVDVLRAGRSATVLAVGSAVAAAIQAADEVGDVEVIDPGLAAPLDLARVAARVRQTGRLIVATPPGEAAWGRRALLAAFGEAFLYLEAPPAVADGDARSVVAALRAALSY